MGTRYKSDVAIIMLNFYPPTLVSRAIHSIQQQSCAATWTLYLGFHHRSQEHCEAVRTICAGLPVHFVTIGRDLVFDVRARDLVLQEALLLGEHRFLFFLDDDDEWFPTYLENMTAPDAPFVTCAKQVVDEERGTVTNVYDDYDYEGMGFHFGLWKDKHLPYFVKQWSDKYIYREYSRMFPNHPRINEPLYRVYQHRDSLTFRKSLGQAEDDRCQVAARELIVVRPQKLGSPLHQDCNAIAQVTGAAVFPSTRLPQPGTRPRILLSPLSTLAACLEQAEHQRRQTGDTVVAIVDQPPESLFQSPRQKRLRTIQMMERADALLLCDPAWVEGYEPIQPHCLPVGVPSLVAEATIRDRCMAASPQCLEGKSEQAIHLAIPKLSFIPQPFLAALLSELPGNVVITCSLDNAAICWCPDIGPPGWGREILKSYELGIVCVASSRTTTAKVLFGGTDLLTDDWHPGTIALRIRELLHTDRQAIINAALPFFRRCFGPFYWLNSFRAYLAALLP